MDKSFIMSISKNNTDLSSYVIGWECGCGNKQEQRRCSGESGGIVRPGGTIPGARVRGGANMLPCVQSWSQSLRHMLLSLSLRCVGVAILTLCVVSRSWSSRHVVLWSWWLSSCRSRGHRHLHILVATSSPHIITIVPLLSQSVVGGCTVVGPGGRGWPRIRRQGW